ncbi:IMPACT family member YvyE [Pullulanibacillus camelliae]|uniref:IMPACT family member YvyE n=1 Tax=Pullulanibacillus camelliae TaxID=1707096 RepID=A0A8J3E031_9BACL|nr:YigZ family protein [Pullulanibacillus camelliae]GGE57047.1 IMPACT family member YvyE [Pullulanibacillus camelliae]
MSQPYYTVKRQAENEIVIQKSKFIAHVTHIENESEAQQMISELNKVHWKANHNCYAYVVGENNNVQKASDAGEPSGTAGVPILEVLKKKDLRDTLVVVTRYFGGIKLGAGGLIRAYSQATTAGIAASGVVERVPVTLYKITIDYPLLGAIENALQHSSYILRETTYTENVALEIAVREQDASEFTDWMKNLTNGQAIILKMDDTFIEVDITSSEKLI